MHAATFCVHQNDDIQDNLHGHGHGHGSRRTINIYESDMRRDVEAHTNRQSKRIGNCSCDLCLPLAIKNLAATPVGQLVMLPLMIIIISNNGGKILLQGMIS
jgi:hypothetical protein